MAKNFSSLVAEGQKKEDHTMKKRLPTQKLPTRFHGMLDYFFAFVMISAPTIGKFTENRITMVIFILLGMLMIVNSLFTKYEHGPFPAIPMKNHLKIDMAIGGLLIVCPWLTGGDGAVIGTITGLFIVATAYISETAPAPEQKKQRGSYPRRSGLSREELYRLYGRSRGARK